MISTEPALTKSAADVREADQVGISDGHPGSPPAKIQPHHLDRLAVVYVRQSPPQQVLEHRKSTALQYNLRTRAIHWGLPSERVLVIDEDQGRSGHSADGRTGFQRLLVEESLDHVGLIDLPPGVVPISMLVQQVLNGLLMRAKRSGAILSSEDRLG